MKFIFIILGLITLSSAMVPRQGRVMPDPADIGEEGSASPPESPRVTPPAANTTATLTDTKTPGNSTTPGDSTTAEPKPLCAFGTPCGWVIYKPPIKFLDYNLTNLYCLCAPGTFCVSTEDDPVMSAYVLRCRDASFVPLEIEHALEDSES